MIHRNYVPSWTTKDALRELLQNALDAGLLSKSPIHITNKGTLELKHLLLGYSSKGHEDLGQFGEGLKLALLVLLRNNITATIYTDTQSITPYWGEHYGEEVLNFDIAPAVVPLTTNCTTIHFSEEVSWDGLYLGTQEEQVLVDNPKLYIGGLFMCDLRRFKHGYNLKPGSIAINRDRSQVSEYEVALKAAPLLVKVFDDIDIADMICDPDINDSTYVYEYASDRVKILVNQRYASLGKPARSVLPYPMKKLLDQAQPEKSSQCKAAEQFYIANKKHMRRAARVAFTKLMEKL